MTKTLTEQQIRKIIENGTGKAAKVCKQKFYDKPKSLTEQWREGTLPDGYYYIDYDTQQRIFEIEDCCATYQGLPAETYFLNDVCLIKVIAPVPSYEEYRELVSNSDELSRKTLQLEKRLEISTKALKKIIRDYEINGIGYLCVTRAKEALKEMEGVK